MEKSRNVTFGDAAAEWMEFIRKERKYSTYVKYKTLYRNYLFSIKEQPLAEAGGKTIRERLYPQINEKSENLKRSVYAMTNQILKYVANHYDLELEPVRNLPAGGSKKKIEVLNQTEQGRLLRYLSQEPDIQKAGIILCLSTGLRLGEICSLKWLDIDRQRKLLHVNSTVQRIEAEGCRTKTILLESEPKTAYSKREIPLSDSLLKLLAEFPAAGIYLLRGTGPMEPRTYQNRFNTYLECAGVHKKNFHTLRHTFATNCINTGADIKSLSEILGHADVKITLNRYVHPTLETKRRHLNNLSAFYNQILK